MRSHRARSLFFCPKPLTIRPGVGGRPRHCTQHGSGDNGSPPDCSSPYNFRINQRFQCAGSSFLPRRSLLPSLQRFFGIACAPFPARKSKIGHTSTLRAWKPHLPSSSNAPVPPLSRRDWTARAIQTPRNSLSTGRQLLVQVLFNDFV
jgi:hypothetical protein